MLRLSAAGAIGTLGLGGTLASGASAATTATETWQFDHDKVVTDSNNHTDNIYGYGQGMVVKHIDTQPTTLDGDDATRYRMEVNAEFTAKGGQSDGWNPGTDDLEYPENTITSHEIRVTEEQNADDMALWSSTDPDLLGFTPSNAGSNTDEDSVLEDSVALGLSLIPNPLTMAAGVGLSAGSIIDQMQTGDNPAEPGDVHFVQDTSNAGDEEQPESNFCRFNAVVKDTVSSAELRVRDVVNANFNYGGTTFGTEAVFEIEGNAGGVSKVSEQQL